jgi:hypothetical protein
MKRTLILDCDGVILRWNANLLAHLMTLGPVHPELPGKIERNEFIDLDLLNMESLALYNQSIFAADLPLLEDSTIHVLRHLAEHYDLVALTSFSDHPDAVKNRRANIELHCSGLFKEIHILPILAPKIEHLKMLSGRFDVVGFVDDSRKHIVESLEVLGTDRTFWLHTFNPDIDLDCHHLFSLAELPARLANAQATLACETCTLSF